MRPDHPCRSGLFDQTGIRPKTMRPMCHEGLTPSADDHHATATREAKRKRPQRSSAVTDTRDVISPLQSRWDDEGGDGLTRCTTTARAVSQRAAYHVCVTMRTAVCVPMRTTAICVRMRTAVCVTMRIAPIHGRHGSDDRIHTLDPTRPTCLEQRDRVARMQVNMQVTATAVRTHHPAVPRKPGQRIELRAKASNSSRFRGNRHVLRKPSREP
jgi:hypothetical protein